MFRKLLVPAETRCRIFFHFDFHPVDSIYSLELTNLSVGLHMPDEPAVAPEHHLMPSIAHFDTLFRINSSTLWFVLRDLCVTLRQESREDEQGYCASSLQSLA